MYVLQCYSCSYTFSSDKTSDVCRQCGKTASTNKREETEKAIKVSDTIEKMNEENSKLLNLNESYSVIFFGRNELFIKEIPNFKSRVAAENFVKQLKHYKISSEILETIVAKQ